MALRGIRLGRSGWVLLVLALWAMTSVPAAHGPEAGADVPAGDEGISWPRNQILPSFAAPRHLDVVDMSGAGGADRMMLATLQGVVNRTEPRIYLIESAEEGALTWLEDLGVPYTIHDDRWEVLDRYRDEIVGMIVYDPDVPDTINVATTMAGLEDAVIAHPNQALWVKATLGISVVHDLRGRFRGGIEAQRWQYENLWPRTQQRMLVSQHSRSTLTVPFPPVTHTSSTELGFVRDYAVANRAMVVYLDPGIPEEFELFERIVGEMEPMSVYLGWFPSDTAGEFEGVELLSRHGILTVPADLFSSMTVFSGVPSAAKPPKPAPVPVPDLEDRIYLTFTMTEGDNLQYMQHRMRVMWDEPARGEVPVNWTVQPLVLDAAPAMLGHYQGTATPNDHFTAGPSGAGYIFPEAWPDGSFDSYTEATARYMGKAGLSTMLVYNRPDRVVPLTEAQARAYVQDIDPAGMLFNWFYENRNETAVLEGTTPLVRGRSVCSVEQGREVIQDLSRDWDGTEPLFLSIGVEAWCQGPSGVRDMVAGLGAEYVPVRGDHFFTLLRESLGLPPVT